MSNSDLNLAALYTWVALALNVGVTTWIVRSLESPIGGTAGWRRQLHRTFAGAAGALAGLLWLVANNSPFYLSPGRGARPYADTFVPLSTRLLLTWVAMSVLIAVATAYIPNRAGRAN